MAPRYRRKNAIIQLNLMIVGFTGLGKTSFLRTFCDTLNVKRKEQLEVPQLQGSVAKTTESYSMTFDVEEEGEKINLTIVDTPGFTDDFNLDKQLYSILNYLDDQFDFTLAEESKVKRNPKALDKQIHACLYFIDPSLRALSPSDIRILKKLTTRVNVIPVIAKADTLTITQREYLKKAILKDLFEAHKIKVFAYPEPEDESEPVDISFESRPQTASSAGLLARSESNGVGNGNDEAENAPLSASGDGSANDAEEEEVLDKNGSGRVPDGSDDDEEYDDEEEEDPAILYLKKLPFTVINFEDFENEVPPIFDPTTGAPIRGRTFPWGTINVLNPAHCDFLALRQVLLTTHRKIFKDLTVEKYYEQYRTDKLLARKARSNLSADVKKKIVDEVRNL